jgi:hypothetical protein
VVPSTILIHELKASQLRSASRTDAAAIFPASTAASAAGPDS